MSIAVAAHVSLPEPSLSANAINSEQQSPRQQTQRRLRFRRLQRSHHQQQNRHFRLLPVLRTWISALSAVRFLPIFTPRATLVRWRSQRAMRSAAREARDKRLERRDWTHRFRLNGLTWHHFYISQDLRRIQTFLKEFQAKPNTISALIPLERSYAYLLNNVWDVYNSLERDVLFPWIQSGMKENSPLVRALQLFSNERNRIEDTANVIQSKFSKLVCTTGYPYASLGPCSDRRKFNPSRNRKLKRKKQAKDAKARAGALTGNSQKEEDSRSKKANLYIIEGFQPGEEDEKIRLQASKCKLKMSNISMDELRQISTDITNLIEDTERLHKTERQLLYPLIAENFSTKEQNRLTNILVYSMRSSLAKFIITIYHQAVAQNDTRAQWKWYNREVPLPIRVYTPIWRARLFDDCPLGWLRTTSVKSLDT